MKKILVCILFYTVTAAPFAKADSFKITGSDPKETDFIEFKEVGNNHYLVKLCQVANPENCTQLGGNKTYSENRIQQMKYSFYKDAALKATVMASVVTLGTLSAAYVGALAGAVANANFALVTDTAYGASVALRSVGLILTGQEVAALTGITASVAAASVGMKKVWDFNYNPLRSYRAASAILSDNKEIKVSDDVAVLGMMIDAKLAPTN